MNPPVIGISGESSDSKSVQAMMSRVRDTHAEPLLLANHARRDAAADMAKFDALIVMGNDFDVDPNDYIFRYDAHDPKRQIHPKTKSVALLADALARTEYEKKLIPLALEKRMPIFAICGGMQLLNVLQGGTLHQHIPDLLGHDAHAKNAGLAASSPVFSVSIVPDTMLARIVKDASLYTPGMPPLLPSEGTVNAFHHQSIDRVGEHLMVCAYSDEYQTAEGTKSRLIEAIEPDPKGAFKDRFILGVQWHPEFLPDNETPARILQNLQEAAKHYALTQGQEHAPQQTKMENILSALPILKTFSEATKDRSQPPSPNTPKKRSR